MVKNSAQDPQDNSLQMKIRQYLVSGRRLPSKEDPNPKVISMRIFARNTVAAKSRFWWNLRRLNKLKPSHGQILAVQELFERRDTNVKTYGIVLKYQSRTTIHNMYKEFRDTTLNGAVSQLYQEMAGNHRAQPQTIHILRTSVLTKSADIKRGKTNQYRGDSIKFPIVKTVPRASHKKFRTIFKAKRPNLYRS
ncbi:unnamed protein product [Paramecium pentaurelia]|uniref:60S ribosomal protein L18a n=1 Tax=Paramecium pentaurelia TaxID=43138 RepID=A0A8S1VB91_9CILI|nr:unnamed protein product [Paramecium pentaurelia]